MAVQQLLYLITENYSLHNVIDFARNLVKEGGLYLNSVRATSAEALVSKDKHLLAGNITIVRVGESTSTSPC